MPVFDDDDIDEDDQPIPCAGKPSSHAAEQLPIADRVMIGIDTGKHFAGGIVPFPPHLAAGNVLAALTGEERKKVSGFTAHGFTPTVYAYNATDGSLLKCVVRFDHPTERKVPLPLRYCGKDSDGQDLFWFTDIPGSKPLYGLDLLHQRPDAPVLVVEGEKTADAAREQFPDVVVITWSGGANAVRRVDMSRLAGRNVTVWPDNDPAGRAAARLFAARALDAGAASAAVVDVPPEFPPKWDLADPLPPEAADLGGIQRLLETARPMAAADATALLKNPAQRAAVRRLLGHEQGYSGVDPTAAEEALNLHQSDMAGRRWYRMAACWYHAFGPAGLPAFDAWSAKGDKYKAGEPAALWARFAQDTAFRGPPLVWLLRGAARAAEEGQRNVTVDADAMLAAEVEALNENHAVVVRGGKTVVIRETFDPRFGRYVVEYMKKGDFTDKHVAKVQLPGENGNPGPKVPLGKLWFGTARRREYDGVIFMPGGDAGRGKLNLWRGFTVKPKNKPEGWSRFKAHISTNVAQGDDASYNYILNWLAFSVQHLDKPAGTALVLTGPKGAGKSILSVLFGTLFGEHHFATAQPGDVLGHFNGHLEHTLTLGLEEAVAPENRGQDSVFKDIINSKTLRIEEKFLGIWVVPNHLRIILTSNNDLVVRADGNERRYAVFKVTNPHIADPNARRAYFGAMVAEMETGGFEAMLGELLARDISGWNAEAIPETAALRRQKLLNLASDPVQSWLHERLTDGIFIVPGDGPLETPYRWGVDHPSAVPARAVMDDFVEYCRRNGYRGTERKLSLKLPGYMPQGFATRVEKYATVDGTSTRRVFDFPPVEEARAAFTAATGIGAWAEAGGS